MVSLNTVKSKFLLKSKFFWNHLMASSNIEKIKQEIQIEIRISSPSRFSSVGRASDSQIFWEHEFESQQPHLCNNMWGQDWQQAGRQEVGMCSTRGGSEGMYITFASAMRIRQSPLWLWNPEETSPEIQNRGISGPPKGHVCPPKTLKKKFEFPFNFKAEPYRRLTLN